MSKSKRSYQVNDFVLDFLVKQGVKQVFLITGGAISFLVDAFHDRKDISYVSCGHEQAAAMMAEAYSRMGPGYAACMATSGPGATNLITGMACAHFDSIPALYITGQVNTYEQRGFDPGTSGVRQVGFQETEIVEMMKPITKYSTMLKKAEIIRYELEKATYIAKSGRPGPVLIDIPMNFQRAPIKKTKLKAYQAPAKLPYRDTGEKLEKKVTRAWKILIKSERPVLLSGGGVRLADGVKEIHKLAKLTKFPVITSWSGFDSFGWDHPQLIGSHGVYGSRAANFTVQNSDALLSVGSRLDTRQTGGRPSMYARESKLIMVDIDKAELDKRRGLTPKLAIQSDAKEFLQEMIRQYPLFKDELPNTKQWLQKAVDWKEKYPNVKPEYYKRKDYVDPYVFGEVLSHELDKKAIIIPDEGGHLTWIMQSFKLKQGQRLFSAFGNSPMGYAFPAAMGASIAQGNKEVICIDGDGGFQFNLQEMQTLAYLKLPIKIFILNNDGYGIIRQFQDAYLDKHHVAVDPKTGVTNPDYMKLGKTFGYATTRIHSHKELKKKIRWALKQSGPTLVEIMMDPKHQLMPKLAFGKPLEDQWPLLPREELAENMIVPLVEADSELTESN